MKQKTSNMPTMPAPIVTVIQNQVDVHLGTYLDLFVEAGLTVRVVHPAFEDFPTEVGDAVVVLGGRMDCYADEECPWLPKTRDLIVKCTEDGTPLLGICLGFQLMTAALGGGNRG